MTWNEQLAQCMPAFPSREIPWERIDRLFAGNSFQRMKSTPQNPVYHGEGDVYLHTQMVCRELIALPEFPLLPVRQQQALFLAALLHDIGKTETTRLEDGAWTSPHHASTGSHMARTLLWQDWGMCGNMDALSFRETVCTLIRWHMLPVRLMEQRDPEKRVRVLAAAGALARDFSWHLLCLLSRADVLGRIAADSADCLTQTELSRMLAEESSCLHAPYPFPDAFTAHACLSGRNVAPDQPLYDDTWGETVMVCGLPGTGKDTWIRNTLPDTPMISLDHIRRELGIKPTDNQGLVIQTAKERARSLLRRKQPFVWNATDTTRETREKLIRLFENYGARVRLVYLETDVQTRLARNAGRPEAVPESAVSSMLARTVPPMPEEAQTVEWICT